MIHRPFTVGDFEGSGQYIVRTDKDHINSDSFLTTITMKVGYMLDDGTGKPCSTLTDLSDGWTRNGHYDKSEDTTEHKQDSSKWKFVRWDTKQMLMDFLNNNPHGARYRPATKEELVRIANYQGNRF